MAAPEITVMVNLPSHGEANNQVAAASWLSGSPADEFRKALNSVLPVSSLSTETPSFDNWDAIFRNPPVGQRIQNATMRGKPNTFGNAAGAASGQITATCGFSLMLVNVRGQVMSANTTCSSSKMRSEPFAETFDLPVSLAVATSDGRIPSIAFLASSVSFAITTFLVRFSP